MDIELGSAEREEEGLRRRMPSWTSRRVVWYLDSIVSEEAVNVFYQSWVTALLPIMQ